MFRGSSAELRSQNYYASTEKCSDELIPLLHRRALLGHVGPAVVVLRTHVPERMIPRARPSVWVSTLKRSSSIQPVTTGPSSNGRPDSALSRPRWNTRSNV